MSPISCRAVHQEIESFFLPLESYFDQWNVGKEGCKFCFSLKGLVGLGFAVLEYLQRPPCKETGLVSWGMRNHMEENQGGPGDNANHQSSECG